MKPNFPFAARTYALADAGFAAHRIGGEHRAAAGGATLTVENPRHGQAMG